MCRISDLITSEKIDYTVAIPQKRQIETNLRILLVEDEIELRESLAQLLNMQGFICNSVGSIASYVAWKESQECDLLIIDRKLPDGDGMDIVKMHRQNSDAAIIILSSLVTEEDKVLAYENDCDLYLEKPIGVQELVAAINNLKRKQGRSRDQAPWIIDMVTWYLTGPNQQQVKLTERETRFLKPFVDNAGVTVSRERLASAVKLGTEFDDYKRLEIIIRRLRKKVAANITELPLLTIYGQGFVFNERLKIVNQSPQHLT